MKKATTTIKGYEFENDDVVLDFTRFEQCKFKNCNIIYYGHGNFDLNSCHFDSCRYSLEGPAGNTISFLKSMYHGSNRGFQELVEATFQNIRQSK